jgi:hypothetical protein
MNASAAIDRLNIHCGFTNEGPDKKKGEGSYKLCLKVNMKAKDGKEYIGREDQLASALSNHKIGVAQSFSPEPTATARAGLASPTPSPLAPG